MQKKSVVYADRSPMRLVHRCTGLDISNVVSRKIVKKLSTHVDRVANALALLDDEFPYSDSQQEPFCYPDTVDLFNEEFVTVNIFFTNSPQEITVVDMKICEHDPDRIDFD